MTNERAVEILKAIIFMIAREYDTDEVEEAIHKAIEALQRGLENVNADEPTCNQLATNLQPSKQDDLISRKAAIDAHYEYCNQHPDAGFPVWSLKILKDLPSAQPEVTEEAVKEYCRKRCLCIVDSALLKKYESAQLEIISEWWKKQKDSAQGQCELIKMYPTGAWYCCNAQRRITDGDTISRQAAKEQKAEESLLRTDDKSVSKDDVIYRAEAIDALCKAGCNSGYCGVSCDDVRAIEALPSAQPEQRYTEEELRVFQHGISLSLLSKRSSQHWQYDEDTATEIKFLERLYEKVVADMRGEQDGRFNQQTGGD